MRYVIPWAGLGGLLLLVGCNSTRMGVVGRQDSVGPPVSGPTPTAAALVKYMDDNAQRVQSLRCDDVELTVARGLGVIQRINLPANVACQRPRNFRLSARMGGIEQVDLGSNTEEFWFWIKQNDPPYQFYCPYQALAENRRVKLPFPFQPEWVMETLGMGNYGPADKYRLVVESDKYRLIQVTQDTQGKAVRKVIVFRRMQARGNVPQITDYLLQEDATGKEICSAHIVEVQGDVNTTGVVPRRLELRWPAEKVTMSMTIPRAKFNPPLPAPLFVRTRSPNLPAVNLATGQRDGQLNALQRVGGR